MLTRIEKQRNLHRLHLKYIGPKEHQTEEKAIRQSLQDAIKKNNPDLLAERIKNAISFTEDLYPRHIAKIILHASSCLLSMNAHLDVAFDGFNIATKRALDPKTERNAAKKAVETTIKLHKDPKDRLAFINHQYRNFSTPKIKHAFARLYYQNVFAINDPIERSRLFRNWITPIPGDRPYFSNRSIIGLIENAPSLPLVQMQMKDYMLAMSKIQNTDSLYYNIARKEFNLALNRDRIIKIGELKKDAPFGFQKKRTIALTPVSIFGLNNKCTARMPQPY